MARLGRGFPTHPLRTRIPTGPRSGTGTTTVSVVPTGTGVKDTSGTGTAAVAVAPTGTGGKYTTGLGTTLVTITPTGSGTKRTGIGPPPRPRVRWQLVAGPASGGHSLSLPRAKARRYTAKLTEASELTFAYNSRYPEAAALDELTTDVHVLYSSQAGTTQTLDRLRVGPTQDILDPAASGPHNMVTFNGLDYRAILQRRYLHSDATLSYPATDQAETAWKLVDYTQNLPGGALGIRKAWTGTSPTGVNVDSTFEVRDSVGDKVQQLSEVIGGFDWDIEPVSASALEMRVWYPQRGVDRGVVLIYGGAIARVQRTVDPANYANMISYTGAAGTDTAPGPTAAELADANIATLPQGRWEANFGDDSLSTQAALDARAAWQLGQSEVLQPVYVLTLKRGFWQGPDHIWLGDPVRLIIKDGRLNVDTSQRVYEVEVTLTESGGEMVVLTLGGPRPSYKRKAAAIARRLSALERR